MKNACRSASVATIAAAMFLQAPASYAAPGDPLTAEFQVDSGNGTLFSMPSAARDGVGDIVIAWARNGSSQGIYARLYDPSGTAKGPEFAIPLAHALPATAPAVAMDTAGDFVVASTSSDAATLSFRIQAQRYAANGTALGAPITVASVPKLAGLGFASQPSVAMDAGGDFVLAWSQGAYFDVVIPESAEAAAGSRSIYARRYAASGAAKGPAFLVESDPPDLLVTGGGPQAVVMDADGNFVVAWINENLYRYTVEYKRYKASGIQQGLKAEVKPLSDKFPYHLNLAADAAGNFTIFWSEGNPGGPYSLVAQGYTAAGKALGAAKAIGSLIGPVSMQPDGEFVLATATGSGIVAQRYSAAAVAEGGVIQVSSASVAPTVAVDGYGDFVVAWGEGTSHGVQQYDSIHARLFSGQ